MKILATGCLGGLRYDHGFGIQGGETRGFPDNKLCPEQDGADRRQFHSALLAFPIIGILVFTVIPLVFMILIAFTSYDHEHQLPGNLFSWVGFDNFTVYWAKEYHIDGFRFDLMGLLTVELMNRIQEELDSEFGRGEKLVYGEPWRAQESPMESGTRAPLKNNIRYLNEKIAVFSDDTRDVIKGHVFYEEIPGFVNGGRGLEENVLRAVSGWRKNQVDFMPKSCSQVVNYISAHDNLTLWDKLVISMHGGKGKNNEYCESTAEPDDDSIFTVKYADVLRVNRLVALIYFTCQGNHGTGRELVYPGGRKRNRLP